MKQPISAKSLHPDSALVASFTPSPNYNDRRGDGRIRHVMLHYTGMNTKTSALARLCDPISEVSCHYLIDEKGEILQLVNEAMRAWHAGKGSWQNAEDLNSSSIGIEIVNPGHEFGYVDFPEKQISVLIDLLLDIFKRNNLPQNSILAHSDIAPLRKEDPGEKFPWGQLASQGLGEWVPAAPVSNGIILKPGDRGNKIEAWQNQLKDFGYGININGEYDDLTTACTAAFQRRFRQKLVDGNADLSTILTMEKLLDARK